MWTALAALGGSALTAGLNWFSQKRANETNIALTRENRDWEERMSNTAVQRHAADLEAAGFNRLMAAGGEGASTPSSSPARVSAPELTPIDILGIQKARADISKTKAETLATLATEKNLGEQNDNLRVQNTVLRAQAQKLLIDMGYTKIQAAKILSDMSGTVRKDYSWDALVASGKIHGERPVDYPENAMSRLPADYWTNPNAPLSTPETARKSYVVRPRR